MVLIDQVLYAAPTSHMPASVRHVCAIDRMEMGLTRIGCYSPGCLEPAPCPTGSRGRPRKAGRGRGRHVCTGTGRCLRELSALCTPQVAPAKRGATAQAQASLLHSLLTIADLL